MKKNIFSLGVLAAAAIALAGCAKTETNVPEVRGAGIPFEFTATSALTKTTNEYEATNWEAGDKVNLFHAELGGTDITYVSDGAFTAATDGPEVKFTGTLAEGFKPEGTYNWYALYPYTSQVTTPANRSAGYVTVGSKHNGTQTQKGNDSMGHIAGNNYPIAGIVEKISGSEKLSIAMTHLTSLIEVAVTNGTSDPITVTDISFTGTEDIVGTYYIDFASSPIVFTPSGSKYITNTAKLTVEDGTPIAAGDKAYFYLAVKPFTAPAGEKLTLSVTTAEHGAQEVEKTLTADAAFEAGVENFLAFNYDKAEITYDEIASLKSGDNALVNGQVTALSASGFVVTDATGSIFVYTQQNEGSNYEIGQEVTVSGSISVFHYGLQFAKGATITKGETKDYVYPNPEKYTEDKISAFNASNENRLAEYVTLTGRIKKGDYVDLLVGDVSDPNVTIYSTIFDLSNYADGDIVVMNGYALSVTTSKCAVLPTSIVVKDAPKLAFEDITDVPAAGVTGQSHEVTVSNNSGWTSTTTCDGTVVISASFSEALNEISYSVSANDGLNSRAGYIKITFSKAGEDDVVYTINVTQKSTVAIDSFSFDLGDSAPSSSSEDLLTWENAIANMQVTKGTTTNANNYCPPTKTSTRFYGGATLTITPATGKKIASVVFSATTPGYATVLANSEWTNAAASVSGSTVTITPTDGTRAISAAIGGTCGFTNVEVTYVK